MSRNIYFLVFIAGVVVLSGCGLKARVYKAERERVDYGPVNIEDYKKAYGEDAVPKKTREVLVLEIKKKDKEDKAVSATAAENVPSQVDQSSAQVQSQAVSISPSPQINLPPITDEDVTVEGDQNDQPALTGTVGFEDYTVQKDDTLQKISKKFYGSFSKWTRIYDANREMLKNPNSLKPGIVLKIPLEK